MNSALWCGTVSNTFEKSVKVMCAEGSIQILGPLMDCLKKVGLAGAEEPEARGRWTLSIALNTLLGSYMPCKAF